MAFYFEVEFLDGAELLNNFVVFVGFAGGDAFVHDVGNLFYEGVEFLFEFLGFGFVRFEFLGEGFCFLEDCGCRGVGFLSFGDFFREVVPLLSEVVAFCFCFFPPLI